MNQSADQDFYAERLLPDHLYPKVHLVRGRQVPSIRPAPETGLPLRIKGYPVVEREQEIGTVKYVENIDTHLNSSLSELSSGSYL
jgi:hypothetical protein